MLTEQYFLQSHANDMYLEETFEDPEGQNQVHTRLRQHWGQQGEERRARDADAVQSGAAHSSCQPSSWYLSHEIAVEEGT